MLPRFRLPLLHSLQPQQPCVPSSWRLPVEIPTAFGYQGSVLSWLVDCSPPGARPVEPCRARCSPAAVETSRVENAARGGAACSFELRSLSEALVQKRTPSRPRRLPLRPSSLRLRKHLLRWRPEEEGGQSAVRNLTCVFLEIIFARL